MIGFAAFIFILFVAVWGSIGMGVLIFGRGGNQVESGNSDALLEAMREELDAVATRLARIEEDMDFFNELHRGSDAPQIPAPKTSGDAGSPPSSSPPSGSPTQDVDPA